MRSSSWQISRRTVTARWKVFFADLREKSRTGIMDGLGNFIEVDNHDAVNVGGLRQGMKSVHVEKPQFTPDFPKQSSGKELKN